ncbi:MAG: hypothetical protein C0506_00185 [Anaerolinea sp.]|nr:hypothetical protein [Anaerolinea sp.]
MWKAWCGLAGLVAALAVAVAAFAIPWLMFPDAEHDVDAATVRYTKGQARLWSSIPPLRLQITAIEPATAPYSPAATATLKWRTIFGVRWGTTVIESGQSRQEWNEAAGMRVWAAFIAAEIGLLVWAGWCFWTSP